MTSAESPAVAPKRRRLPPARIVVLVIVGLLVVIVAAAVWIGVRSLLAKDQLEAAVPLASHARAELVAGDSAAAATTLKQFAEHARSAADLTSDPIFAAGVATPIVGPNLAALRSISRVVDEIATDGIAPLLPLAGSVDLASIAPVAGRIDVAPLVDAAPALEGASGVFDRARAEVAAIDTSGTIDQVTVAVDQLSSTVDDAASALDGAAITARLLPAMLGSSEERNYLLVFQNNAELRATGGIPGAMAVLTASDGRLSLTAQAASTDFPHYSEPVLPVDSPEQSLFGNDLARYMQDVNYSPEFPSAAQFASEMWFRQYGQRLDGVVAVDPVFLGYLLNATGPITLATGDTVDSGNAATFLMSTVYAKYPNPAVQDLVFADAARQVFAVLTDRHLDTGALADAFSRGAAERRILIWNTRAEEQDLLADSEFGGTLPKAVGERDTIGVYFNDATGAKMDVYLDASIQVTTDSCTADATAWATAVTMTSTAPGDSATSLPRYVTGGGASGVSPGTIRTRVLVYGPVGSIVTDVQQDGVSVPTQVEQHLGRSVVQLVVDLTPGQATTITTTQSRDGSASGDPKVRMTPMIRSITPKTLSRSCT